MEINRGRELGNNNRQRAKTKTTINRGQDLVEDNRLRAKSRGRSKSSVKKEIRSKTIDGRMRSKSKNSKKNSTNISNMIVISSSKKIVSTIHLLTKTLNLNFRIDSKKSLKYNFRNSNLEKYVDLSLEFSNLESISLDKSQDFNNLVKSIKNIPLPKEITLQIKNGFRSYFKGEKVKNLGGLTNIFSKKEEENLSLNFKGEKPTFLMLMSIENIKRELNHIKNMQQIVDEKVFKEINFVVLLKQGNLSAKDYKKMLKEIGIKHDGDNIKFYKIVNKKNVYSSNFLLLGVENFDEKLSYHDILITKDGKYLKTLDNKLDNIKTELKKLLSYKEDVVNNLKKIIPDEIIEEKKSNLLVVEDVDIVNYNKSEIKKIKEFYKSNCEKIRKLNVNLEKINFSHIVSYRVVNDKIEKFISFKPEIEISIQKKYSNFVNSLLEFLKSENLTEKVIFRHNVLDLMQEYLDINEMIEKRFTLENLPYDRDNFSILKTNTTDIYEGYLYKCTHKFISKLWMKTIDFQIYKKYEKIESDINTTILEKNYYLKKIRLKPKKMVGDIFDSIELVISVTNKKSVISAKKNEVLVVEFWETLCLDSLDSMNENQKNMKQNKNWKEQVRFIGLSIDENVNEVKKCIKENKLNLIDHYIIDKNNEQSKVYIDAYGGNMLPRLVIVNKFGNIAYLGSPFDIDLNEVINELVDQIDDSQVIESLKDFDFEDFDEGEDEAEDEDEDEYMEEEEEEEEEEDDEGQEEDEVEEECDLLNIEHNKFKNTRNIIIEHMNNLSSNNYNQATFIEEKCLYNFADNNFRKILKKFNFSTNLRQKDHSILENLFISKVYPIIPKEILKPNIILMQTFQLFRGINCSTCNNNINTKSQYFCYECNIFFCDLCANQVDSSKRGMDRLNHNHNLIFIPSCVTELTEIDVKRIGKNKASKEKNIKRRDHDNACNCCEKMIDGSRFVCMNCYPGVCDNFVDICEKCLMILIDEKHIDHKETVKFCLENDGHKIESHVYLRLWYCNGSYLNY